MKPIALTVGIVLLRPAAAPCVRSDCLSGERLRGRGFTRDPYNR
jgi:hypothetical protein